jgi:hypothetical protein
MKTRGFIAILLLIFLSVCIDAEAAPNLDICGKLYEIYDAFVDSNFTEEQQKEYFQHNLEGKKFQVTSTVKDVSKIKNGIRLHLNQDKCVSVFADSLFPDQCELNYILSLNKGDQVTIEGTIIYYSNSSDAIVKLNDSKIISSPCDSQTNAEHGLKTTPQNSSSIETPLHDKSQSDCPEDFLSAGSIKGIYLGTFCVDYCFSTIKIVPGKEISIMCEDDEAHAYFGEGTGQQVEINYDIVQFWNQYEQKCQLATVCKSGKALSSPTRRTN